ncbi:MAG: hypothetical protein HY664_03845 [Chloroflexi bacterium]|nr:hypothetical protein [Chloroflexota bacterium]
MFKGFVEYDYNPGEELVIRFHRPKFVSAATKGHILASEREFLLALRSLLDQAVQSVERREKKEKGEKEKIEVQ